MPVLAHVENVKAFSLLGFVVDGRYDKIAEKCWQIFYKLREWSCLERTIANCVLTTARMRFNFYIVYPTFIWT